MAAKMASNSVLSSSFVSSKSIRHVVFQLRRLRCSLGYVLREETSKTSKTMYCLRISGPFIQTKPNSQATDKNNDTTVLVSADIMRRSHSSSVSRVCESLRILHKDYRPDAEEGGISSTCDETLVKGEGPARAFEQKDAPKG